jgi:hypothetical protein
MKTEANALPHICGAYARRTGQPCKGKPMENGRCRMHGGTNPGRPVTTGQWTNEARAARKLRGEISRMIRGLSASLR